LLLDLIAWKLKLVSHYFFKYNSANCLPGIYFKRKKLNALISGDAQVFSADRVQGENKPDSAWWNEKKPS